VTQHDHAFASRLFLVRTERAPERQVGPQQLEEIRRHRRAGKPLGLTADRQVEVRIRRERRQMRKRARALSPIDEVRRSHGPGVPVLEIPFLNHDQPIGVRIGQRLDQQRVADAEDRGIGCDPESQGQNRGGRKHRRTPEHADGQVHVAPGRLDERQALELSLLFHE
jgi:hypothetical protein